ncbi:hypothetical protein K450DRAFT_256770 [Umbelopsis ramanniana AG]|uniref:Uncharacterized protein n=1 Tax=Umbelopsis ramanniana AG TaxID=1314678 RepID=A0AAD5E2Z0_UMBRA|nr:uncharacterized protein K450DRAFT_256770 [Umbelopsis ramanniana AG]KAI8576441.1 hypothetical protein K450DRAFT_256770 [Umbelopsis ramanniana AG]
MYAIYHLHITNALSSYIYLCSYFFFFLAQQLRLACHLQCGCSPITNTFRRCRQVKPCYQHFQCGFRVTLRTISNGIFPMQSSPISDAFCQSR